jgi:hypothetical protein
MMTPFKAKKHYSKKRKVHFTHLPTDPATGGLLGTYFQKEKEGIGPADEVTVQNSA